VGSCGPPELRPTPRPMAPPATTTPPASRPQKSGRLTSGVASRSVGTSGGELLGVWTVAVGLWTVAVGLWIVAVEGWIVAVEGWIVAVEGWIVVGGVRAVSGIGVAEAGVVGKELRARVSLATALLSSSMWRATSSWFFTLGSLP